MSDGVVKSYGPTNAKVLWIGEAPGREEVIEGRPFVGASGEMARKELRAVGIDDKKDVRWCNCVQINPGEFPDGQKGAWLLEQWKEQLDEEIDTFEGKVIVLCGGKALLRVTGYSSIYDWRGSVLRDEDIKDELVWHSKKDGTPLVTHKKADIGDKVIIPVLHPAGIMRSKDRDDIVLLKRDVRKVKAVLYNRLKKYDMVTHFSPDVGELWEVFKNAEEIVFDTEFHRHTKELYWTGMTKDGVNVYGFPNTPEYYHVLKRIMEGDGRKVAHNISADAEVLEKAGISLEGEWYCTLLGMYVLFPRQKVGLSPTSRYFMDDVKNHKWMNKNDPVYNAIDVLDCYWCKVGQIKECEIREINPVGRIKSRVGLISVCKELQDKGMRVDFKVREELIKEQEEKIVELQQKIDGIINPMWFKRVEIERRRLAEAEKKYVSMRSWYLERCSKHPKYYPSKKPPKCELCVELYNDVHGEMFRKEYDSRKKIRDKIKSNVKGWEDGFNFKSPEHFGWLLYNPDALHLPIQRTRDAKRKKTTNADAIERLSNLKVVKEHSVASELMFNIKAMQQANKACSTWLRLEKKDKESKQKISLIVKGRVHANYKIHGTETGRLAGGADSKGEMDKIDNREAYNPLNIPKPWRRMYIPDEGYVLVSADWKNQEGRICAFLSGDKQLIEAFKEEDNGGVDVHSRTAAVIYGIDPLDARKEEVRFNMQMHDMRHVAKVAGHACRYSPTPVNTLMKNFQMDEKEAIEFAQKFEASSVGFYQWRKSMLQEVLGEWQAYRRGKLWRAQCVKTGRRWSCNPFGWQIYWLGMGEVRKDKITGEHVAMAAQAGDLIAWYPQSTGADMWADCGPDVRERYKLFHCAYDNFTIQCKEDDKEIREAGEYLKEVMEKEWEEMNGLVVPIEVQWGYNLMERKEGVNERGLRELM